MTSDPLDAYARAARVLDDDFLAAGRYLSQKAAWPRVIADVAAKLRLTGSESLLDVGCGPGLLTLPLLPRLGHAWALDHPDVVRRLAARAGAAANLTCLEGDLLGFDFGGQRFDRVLAYGVLLCLADLAQANAFVDTVASLLAPGGIALIGDIPNRDRKARFLATPFGRRFDAAFRAERSAATAEEGQRLELFASAVSVDSFSDAELLLMVARLRGRGFDAALVPQTGDLCFGWTREDLLIARLPE